MGVRVARALAGPIGRGFASVFVCLGLTAARAEEPPVPPPPELSRNCEAPATDIATPEPLPRLAVALRDRKAIKVLAIGSSSTVGIGASSPSANYPAQLESILERTFHGLDVVVVNRGVSGETADRTSERLKVQVALDRPDLVLWQVGTNDALARVPVENFVITVGETLRWLKENGVDVVLVGLQYTFSVAKDEYYTSFRMALRKLAADQNVLLVRRYEAMRFIETAHETELVSKDGLHLNDAGYRCMAEHIARAVVVSAFLARKR